MNDLGIVISKEISGKSALNKLRSWLRSVFRRRGETLSESVSELIEEHNEDGTKIGVEEQFMLHNVLSYNKLKAEDIMIPRSDICAIPIGISTEELKQLILKERYTRLPIYKGNLDEMQGFINIKDILPVLFDNKKLNLKKRMRKLLVVSPSMRLVNLLAQMKNTRIHMALVVDEYGGADGLVTIEDLVEEIIGEIEDEHDSSNDDSFKVLGETSIEANARMEIEDLEKLLKVNLGLRDENINTVGGLIMSEAGHVPKKFEKIKHKSGLEFEITECTPRAINKVIIRKKK